MTEVYVPQMVKAPIPTIPTTQMASTQALPRVTTQVAPTQMTTTQVIPTATQVIPTVSAVPTQMTTTQVVPAATQVIPTVPAQMATEVVPTQVTTQVLPVSPLPQVKQPVRTDISVETIRQVPQQVVHTQVVPVPSTPAATIVTVKQHRYWYANWGFWILILGLVFIIIAAIAYFYYSNKNKTNGTNFPTPTWVSVLFIVGVILGIAGLVLFVYLANY